MELAKRLRPITEAEALSSYEALKVHDCWATPGLERAGLKTLDYFFLGHRLKAKTKHHLSFADAMADPAKVRFLNELVAKYKKREGKRTDQQVLQDQYSVFQLWYGTINQFRPTAAKWVYCQLGAKKGILDFSAGWGGRALAAMSLGIPYTGFDANVLMKPAYKKLIDFVGPTAPTSVTFQPSETADFSKVHPYDLVFTSPPYFMLEEYEEMPAYKDKANFLQRFFVPVVMSAWRHLLPGGHMALNMPPEMYEAIRDHLPPLKTVLKLPLHNRHPTNASKRQGLGAEDVERSEPIYVWHKAARGRTRRHTKKTKGGTRKQTRKPGRQVICRDALPWLEEHRGTLASVVTSIPDQSEVGLAREPYIAFFRRAAALSLAAVKSRGYAVFLQTDRKSDGWLDKSYLIIDEATKQGLRLLWHKIALRRDVGKTDLFRPTYSHMLAFSAEAKIGVPLPNVIERGEVTYGNAFGAAAVDFVIRYLKRQGVKEVVDPFVGSGTTLAIANNHGLAAIGLDIDPAQCRKAATLTLPPVDSHTQ